MRNVDTPSAMHKLDKRFYLLAMALSALAGYVDAIGFLHLGGYFISFMSGNSTRFAVALTAGDTSAAALLGMILALFVAGAALGMLVRHGAPASLAKPYVLGCVTLLLACAAFSNQLGWALPAIMLMTLAMGVENAALQRDGEVVVGLTYMTGALVKAGQWLAKSLLGGPKNAWLPYLLLWLGLIAGGILGTWLFGRMGLQSLWIAAFWSGSLTAVTALARHRLTL